MNKNLEVRTTALEYKAGLTKPLESLSDKELDELIEIVRYGDQSKMVAFYASLGARGRVLEEWFKKEALKPSHISNEKLDDQLHALLKKYDEPN